MTERLIFGSLAYAVSMVVTYFAVKAKVMSESRGPAKDGCVAGCLCWSALTAIYLVFLFVMIARMVIHVCL